MELTLQDGGGTIVVSDAAFNQRFNEALVHQAVVASMAGARRGTKAQKTRSDVRGGGAKPWRQKGTGRARAGTIRSPLWRQGGVTFAARPRDHSQRLNRKMYRGAIRSILSELVRQERVAVVGDIAIEAPRTRLLAERLSAYGGADVLIVVTEIDEKLALASRNLPRVEVISVNEITPVNLLRYARIMLTSDAVQKIEGWLA